ncbi:unnamed protein product [Closterium sp. Naga37s-1]|nr:unnamed protein product [Closterium sp. Naga37s-1]
MTATQEGGVVASGKITVPLCVSTFSFFVNAKPGVVLTATQAYQIYSGAISAWGAVPGAVGKVAGAITRVARSDKSGSTAIVKTMWSKAVSGYGDGTDGTAMTYAGLTKVEGTTAVCAAVLKTKGAIGYAFTGGCSVVYNRRKPNNPNRVIAALKNANGVAVVGPRRGARGRASRSRRVLEQRGFHLEGRSEDPCDGFHGLSAPPLFFSPFHILLSPPPLAYYSQG